MTTMDTQFDDNKPGSNVSPAPMMLGEEMSNTQIPELGREEVKMKPSIVLNRNSMLICAHRALAEKLGRSWADLELNIRQNRRYCHVSLERTGSQGS